MSPKTLVDALLGFIITFGTSLGALLAQNGVSTLADISQGAYVAAFVGALVATAKLVQSRLADPATPSGPNGGQAGFARPQYLAVLGLSVLLALAVATLPGCIAPAPVENPTDAIAQGYAAIETIGNTTAQEQKLGTVSDHDASNIKSALQQAHDLLDAAKAAPAGSSDQAKALSQAQTLLALIRQQIVNRGSMQ